MSESVTSCHFFAWMHQTKRAVLIKIIDPNCPFVIRVPQNDQRTLECKAKMETPWAQIKLQTEFPSFAAVLGRMQGSTMKPKNWHCRHVQSKGNKVLWMKNMIRTTKNNKKWFVGSEDHGWSTSTSTVLSCLWITVSVAPITNKKTIVWLSVVCLTYIHIHACLEYLLPAGCTTLTWLHQIWSSNPYSSYDWNWLA